MTYDNIAINCGSPDHIIGAVNDISPGLPDSVSRQLNYIKLVYWQRYGEEGLFGRFNNRTIGEILAEFEAYDHAMPIASGEIDGLRYQLYGAPDSGTSPKSSLDKNNVGDD